MTEEYISVSEALKLVTPFDGNKLELLVFISNVDAAFEVINWKHEDTLYKFVLTRNSDEPRTAKAHRNFESSEEVKEI
jgi:hypothetical protein